MDDEMTIDRLHRMAQRAGLNLDEDELQRLLPGVNRSISQAADLRELIGATDEPAAKFHVPGAAQE